MNSELIVTPEQWKRISELLTEALKRPPGGRAEYLNQACSNGAIRREVESLLLHYRDSEFLGAFTTVPGKTIGHYRIIEEIGHGSMGQVCKAHDLHLDRLVALKFVPSWIRGDYQAQQRLYREARAASAFNHPNIVSVFELVEEPDIDFIVMEYIAGQTLDCAIPAEGFPIGEVVSYARQITEALVAVHGRGILHNDLKPSNIMVTTDGRIKLLDFSLARAIATAPAEPTASEAFGSIAFMAPERIGAQLRDPRSEVFSLGVIFYQMLSGRHPFRDGPDDEIAERIRKNDPEPLSEKTPVQLARIVLRCLSKSADARFQSMHQLQQALRQLSGATTFSDSIGEAPGTFGVLDQGVSHIERVTTRITYSHLANSRLALAELSGILERGATRKEKDAIIAPLKNLILTLDDYPDGVPRPVRAVRKLVMDVLKTAIEGGLNRCFADHDLDHLDLFGMNFCNAQMSGMSFRSCFLVEANFRDAHLDNASFAGAWVRNADFSGSDLTGVDLTDVDWFNASGLLDTQLERAQRHTLLPCPSNEESMRERLNDRYGFSFASWSTQVQEQLRAAWREYLRPRGLSETVARWRSISH